MGFAQVDPLHALSGNRQTGDWKGLSMDGSMRGWVEGRRREGCTDRWLSLLWAETELWASYWTLAVLDDLSLQDKSLCWWGDWGGVEQPFEPSTKRNQPTRKNLEEETMHHTHYTPVKQIANRFKDELSISYEAHGFEPEPQWKG